MDIRIVDLLTYSSGLPSYANTAELIERYGVAHPDTLMSRNDTAVDNQLKTVARLIEATAT